MNEDDLRSLRDTLGLDKTKREEADNEPTPELDEERQFIADLFRNTNNI